MTLTNQAGFRPIEANAIRETDDGIAKRNRIDAGSARFPSETEQKSGRIAPAAIEVEDLAYPPILHAIEGTWAGGDLVGLVGPNGAGKSTLLRLLAGVWKPKDGVIRVNDHLLVSKGEDWRAKQIAYLPQQMSDHIPYTVAEYVAMGRYVYRTPAGALTAACKKRITEGLRRMNLEAYRDVPMSRLSGGERQRAAVARCFVQESPILLLDEPIASLDLFYQMDILAQLRDLASQGYLVLVVLHNIELAARFCSHLIMLKDGRIVRQGRTQEVFTEEAVRHVFGLPLRVYADPFSGHLRMSILEE